MAEYKIDENNKETNYKKDILYVTGFSDKDDENEYNIITSKYGLIFSGKL